jgi:hypothetical protein
MGEGAVYPKPVTASHFETKLRDGKAMLKIVAD